MPIRTSNFSSITNLSLGDWYNDYYPIDPMVRLKNFGLDTVIDSRTIDYDFTSNTLNSKLQFTRNSFGSYIGSDGYIKYSHGNNIASSRGPAYGISGQTGWGGPSTWQLATTDSDEQNNNNFRRKVLGRTGVANTGSRIGITQTGSVSFSCSFPAKMSHAILMFWVKKVSSSNNYLQVGLYDSGATLWGNTTIDNSSVMNQGEISILSGNATITSSAQVPNLFGITFNDTNWVKVKIIRKTESDIAYFYPGGTVSNNSKHIFDFSEFQLNFGYEETPYYATGGTEDSSTPAIITNIPRFTYDSENLSSGIAGLLLETQTANHFPDYNTVFSYADITVTGGGRDGPKSTGGTYSGTYISGISPEGIHNTQRVAKGTGAASYFAQTGVFSSTNKKTTTCYTVSRYFKRDANTSTIQFSIETNSTADWGLGFNPRAVFNIEATGIITISSQSNCKASVKNAGNGWYRCSMSFVTGAAISSVNSPATILYQMVTNSSSLLTFGGQLEEGEGATSLIPTCAGGGIRTRAYDDILLSGDNFTNSNIGFNADVPGSVFVETTLIKKPNLLQSWGRFFSFVDSNFREGFGGFFNSTTLGAGSIGITGRAINSANQNPIFDISQNQIVRLTNGEVKIKLIGSVHVDRDSGVGFFKVNNNDNKTLNQRLPSGPTAKDSSTGKWLAVPNRLRIGAPDFGCFSMILKRFIFWPNQFNTEFLDNLTIR